MPHALPAGKLLFSHGRFERSPLARTQLPSSSIDRDIKHSLPSPSVPDHFCCRRRRASTGNSYGGDNHHLLHQRLRKEEEEEEHDGGISILHNFSILAEGILAIWEGEDSVRTRIEGLGERQKVMKQEIQGAEMVQRELQERLRVLEQHSREEQASLEHLKEERLRTLAQGINTCSSRHRHHHHHHHNPFGGMHVLGTNLCTASAPRQQQHQCRIDSNAYCLASAGSAPIFSSRQCVAFEMLEVMHNRLTSHMWAHMCERVRGIQGEEGRGEYLQVFRGIEGQSVFGAKPLSEGTYAELLGFIEKKGPIEEVNKAMAAAEERLAEEACRDGYAREHIGDIRKQMAVYLHCHRHFKSAELRSSLQRYRSNLQGLCANNDRLDRGQFNVISETQQAASLGKLGALQPASKLIQLGCYFLCKSSKV